MLEASQSVGVERQFRHLAVFLQEGSESHERSGKVIAREECCGLRQIRDPRMEEGEAVEEILFPFGTASPFVERVQFQRQQVRGIQKGEPLDGSRVAAQEMDGDAQLRVVRQVHVDLDLPGYGFVFLEALVLAQAIVGHRFSLRGCV